MHFGRKMNKSSPKVRDLHEEGQKGLDAMILSALERALWRFS